MTFTYKCRATRQKLSASFGGFVKIIMGNSSSLIILTFTVAYYHNLHLVSPLQFKQFPELISFVLFRVARLDTTSITVHLLAGFSQEMAGLIPQGRNWGASLLLLFLSWGPLQPWIRKWTLVSGRLGFESWLCPLGKSFHLSVPQFPHLQNSAHNIYLIVL